MKKLIVILAICSTFVFAKSTIIVIGTSTLHDWKMVTNSIDLNMTQENGKFIKLDVSFAVKSLKSGDSGLDDTAYEAMHADKYDIVKFYLIKHNDDGTIEGVIVSLNKEKKEILTPTLIEEGHIAGSFKVKMTDFGIKPPSFLFGAMSAGDEITVQYDIKQQ